MKKLFIFLLFLSFGLFSYADFNFEITQEMKKKQAEITITGKTFNEVWKATTRTLMSLKFQIKESDKDSGVIFAPKRRTIAFDAGETTSAWNIMIESDEGEIIVFCVYSSGAANPLSSGKKAFKKFHKKLKERLNEKS